MILKTWSKAMIEAEIEKQKGLIQLANAKLKFLEPELAKRADPQAQKAIAAKTPVPAKVAPAAATKAIPAVAVTKVKPTPAPAAKAVK